MAKKKYYKPKSLIIGILLFGVSMLCVGILIMINVKNGVQNSQDLLYGIGFIVSIIGLVIGEGFILNAASYDANCTKGEQDG